MAVSETPVQLRTILRISHVRVARVGVDGNWSDSFSSRVSPSVPLSHIFMLRRTACPCMHGRTIPRRIILEVLSPVRGTDGRVQGHVLWSPGILL